MDSIYKTSLKGDEITQTMKELLIEWDEEKNQLNIKKHGISFEAAALVFNDEHYIELFDEDHSVDEDRYIAIGLVDEVLFVVHTMRKETIRLISARLATKQERSFYYDSKN